MGLCSGVANSSFVAGTRKRANAALGPGLTQKFCLCVLLVFCLLAILAPLVAPYPPNHQDLAEALWTPRLSHPLGQDDLGRDMLSRVIYGGRVSLSVSFLAGTLAAVIGIFLGLIAGFFGGVPGRLIMGFTDVLLSVPNLVFSLMLVAIMGGGVLNLVFAVGLGMVPSYIRMVNGLALSLGQSDYVTAARLLGQKEGMIMLKHVLPNCFPTLITLYTINLGNAVLTESTLSYLGVGISPPTASWGSMVSDVYPYLLGAPWLVIAPSACIVLVIVSFNVVGDALRDRLDPRLRGRV